MVDPVILCETGVSYERRNIEEWVEAHGYDESSHGPRAFIERVKRGINELWPPLESCSKRFAAFE